MKLKKMQISKTQKRQATLNPIIKKYSPSLLWHLLPRCYAHIHTYIQTYAYTHNNIYIYVWHMTYIHHMYASYT